MPNPLSRKKIGARYVCDQSPFYKLRSKVRLASILKIIPSELKTRLQCAKRDYSEFDLTNPNGKKRHIEVPKTKLYQSHKRIEILLNRIFPPNYLFCPVKRRSYVTNAKAHVTAEEIAVLDIKSYYPSTRASRVYQFFHEEMQCEPDVAWALTTLCSFNGHLPTGSPVSPILSFLAHKRMWDRIAKVVEEAGCRLTVYIDDLTISGQKVPGRLVWAVKQAIKNTGLNYHKEKFYRGKRARRVTGVIIKNNELWLPNKKHLKIHELRLELAKQDDQEKRKELLEKIRGSESQLLQIKAANG